MFKQIHPSKMSIGMVTQLAHVSKVADAVFMQASPAHDDELINVPESFIQVGYRVVIKPQIFQSLHSRDIFVVNVQLLKEISLTDNNLHEAKALFHDLLSTYVPAEGDGRKLSIASSRSARSLHIDPKHWQGKYYDNSHTLGLLVQGLLHV